MFERPIVLSTDNQLNKELFQDLRLDEHLIAINKLLNEHYVNINPAIAIKLIIPQKQKLTKEKSRIFAELVKSFPFLEGIKTFEDFSDPSKVPPQLSSNLRKTFYSASVEFHNNVSEQNQSTSVGKDGIAITSLYPLLISPQLLDDDHVQLPTMQIGERKKTLFPLLSTAIAELKLRFKKASCSLQEFASTGLLPLMLLSQKVNALLTFSPHQTHYELVPMLAEFAKTLEWTLTYILTKEKIAELDSQSGTVVKLYKNILTDQLYLLYLYISETIAYHPDNDSLEELNYAEWCSDKFYAYHLFGEDENELRNNNPIKKMTIEPSKHKQKFTARYFLNRTLIEAKRDSLDLAVSYYEDFLDFVESHPTVLPQIEMTRCYSNVALLLEKSLAKPDPFLLQASRLIQRTINILSQKPDFLNYKELFSLAKKTKLNLFSHILGNELRQSQINSQLNLDQNSITISLSQEVVIKKSQKLKTNPAWLERINFDSQKKIITIILQDASLSLTSSDNFQDVLKFSNYLFRNIQKKQVEKPKPLPNNVLTTTVTSIVESSVSIEKTEKSSTPLVTTKPQLEKSSSLPTMTVENERTKQNEKINELEEKVSQLTIHNGNRSRKKSTSSPTTTTTKSKKKAEIKPRHMTAQELGFHQFPDHIVTPIYFGLNQKKKSTNTYLIWNKVPNLSTEAEEHFRKYLDPEGITVAKNIDDSGVKIHRPPSEKNNPLFCFMRLKSKSKKFGGIRVAADFVEKTESLLPENQGKPIYLYALGKVKHK